MKRHAIGLGIVRSHALEEPFPLMKESFRALTLTGRGLSSLNHHHLKHAMALEHTSLEGLHGIHYEP